MLKVQRHQGYIKDLADLLENDPELSGEIERRIVWFRKNSDDTRLDDHELDKRMKGNWAFSITGDIRIVYKWLGKNEVRFLAIGGHIKVYNNRTRLSS